MIKRLMCKLFGHKWKYGKFCEAKAKGLEGQLHFRFCRCGKIQYRSWHMGTRIWMSGLCYTEKGANDYVEGYGEE